MSGRRPPRCRGVSRASPTSHCGWWANGRALDIILAGKSERAAKAFRLGIVDELVHPAILGETAIKAALRLADSGKPRPRRGGGLLLDRNPLGRRLVYSQARKM